MILLRIFRIYICLDTSNHVDAVIHDEERVGADGGIV